MSCQKKQPANSKYIYLEKIKEKKALNFVKKQNNLTLGHFQKHPQYKSINKDILALMNDPENLPDVLIFGDYVYNFLRDKTNIRGLFRRMTLKNFIKGSKRWQKILDIDALAKKEKENWVWKGGQYEYYAKKRVIISLSRGGKDATVKREFDVETRRFVKKGFNIPKENKGGITWLDENRVLVTSDFGPDSLTAAGYPKILKLWKRGEDLNNAKVVYKIAKNQQCIWATVDYNNKKIRIAITSEMYKHHFYNYDLKNNKIFKYPLPDFIHPRDFIYFDSQKKKHLLISTNKDWKVSGKTFKAGDLLDVDEKELMRGKIKVKLVFRQKENQALSYICATKSTIMIEIFEDVNIKYIVLRLKNKRFRKTTLKLPQKMCNVYAFSIDNTRNDFFLQQEGFLTPETLYYYNPQKKGFEFIAKTKSGFDESKYRVKQFFALSNDGTKVPYFQVARKDIVLNGKNPALIYAYGGFSLPTLPYYSKIQGRYLLEKNGVFILANIRGGNEYGPLWHKSAIREKRQNSFNDFYAVAKDLIKRKVSCSSKLGISGSSNGGLLVSVAFTQRPKLFGAVVCSMPLTDMERYHKLLSGSVWIAEYGNPDVKKDLKFLLKYSPLHQLKKNISYPRVFVTTATNDDRVHPAHARKLVAKMNDLKHPVYYYENTEGGHEGAANNIQAAKMYALQYLYLYEQLGMYVR